MAVYDPFDEIRKVQKEMNRVFERFFGSESEKKLLGMGDKNENLLGFREPLVDIKQTDSQVKVALEMPGVDKQDIDLEIKGDMLYVRAQRKHEINQENKGFIKSERRYQGFYRTIPLPTHVKSEGAQADYRDGVLNISIPKIKVLEKKNKVLIK